MKTMAISQFKAYALKILDQVANSKESIVITKRGKPLAEVVPFRDPSKKPEPGKLADTLVFEKDLVSPLGENMWDSCK